MYEVTEENGKWTFTDKDGNKKTYNTREEADKAAADAKSSRDDPNKTTAEEDDAEKKAVEANNPPEEPSRKGGVSETFRPGYSDREDTREEKPDETNKK